MSPGREIAVSLSLTSEKPTTGTAILLDRTRVSRATRAVVTTLVLWVIGAFMFFIPLAHFVLIPAFFFAGLVMGVVRFLDDVSLISARGECPRCKVPRTFEGAGRYREGRTVHCNGCGSQIAVTSSPR